MNVKSNAKGAATSGHHVSYFGQTPDQGTGSPINMLRHLKRLAAKGWRVSVVGEAGQSTASCDAEGWPVHRLSLRKAWWPPFRPDNPLLRKMRMRLWARECDSIFHHPPQAIFTYLSLYSELHAEVAAHYSVRCGAPLSVIVYDYPPDFPAWQGKDPSALLLRQNWILQRAHQVWFVSPELGAKYDLPPEKQTVLMPMPEGYRRLARWRPDFADRPLIVYAGFVYPVQIPVLARLGRTIHEAGGQLLVLSRLTPELRSLCESEPVLGRDLFPTNQEALDFVASTAAGLLASYSDQSAEMPWITTSFPSKFVEFAHLGLPTLLAAPRDSAIGRWAQAREYADLSAPKMPRQCEPSCGR